jgi:hypothetical protein
VQHVPVRVSAGLRVASDRDLADLSEKLLGDLPALRIVDLKGGAPLLR